MDLKNDFKGNPEAKEFKAEVNNYAPSKAKKAAKAVTALFTAAGLVTLIFSAFLDGGLSAVGKHADIASVWSNANEIGYTVVAQDDGLSLRLYDGNLSREEALEKGENSGVISGLAPGRIYTMEVSAKTAFGSSAVTSRRVRTKDAE